MNPDSNVRAAASEHDDAPVAVVCGGGMMPFAVADALAKRGRRPILFAIEGHADPERVAKYPHHWIIMGKSGRIVRLLHDEECRDVVLVGRVVRPRLSDLRLDWHTIRLLPRLAAALRGGDNHLLSSVGRMFEREGFHIVGVQEAAPEILVPAGVLGKVRPSERDRRDITRGLEVLTAMSPFDIGQAVVVANNHVVAVEGVEGTDLLLERIAELRQRGRLRAPHGVGVIVKAPKRKQDVRFDLPSVGPHTIEGMVRAGLAGIAMVAGASLIVQTERLIALADQSNVFVVGISEDGTFG